MKSRPRKHLPNHENELTGLTAGSTIPWDQRQISSHCAGPDTQTRRRISLARMYYLVRASQIMSGATRHKHQFHSGGGGAIDVLCERYVFGHSVLFNFCEIIRCAPSRLFICSTKIWDAIVSYGFSIFFSLPPIFNFRHASHASQAYSQCSCTAYAIS